MSSGRDNGYGGPRFRTASMLPLAGGLGRPGRLAALLASVLRRPNRAVALAALLVRTETVRVGLTDGPAGTALRAYLGRRFLGVVPHNRYCRGVLLLPDRHTDYLRGRCRQALRTNLRRAERGGIRCESTTDRTAFLEAVWAVSGATRGSAGPRRPRHSGDGDAWPRLLARPEMSLFVARDPAGTGLAVTAAVIDDQLCLIRFALAASHEARWALHDHLVRRLIERGVRYLIVEGEGPFGALGFPAAVHHYQRLLGYELRHVVPAPGCPDVVTEVVPERASAGARSPDRSPVSAAGRIVGAQ